MPTSHFESPGMGIDIVEVSRIARILGRRPAFGARYFGPLERREPFEDHARWYATCLAAKEAFVKALGIGVLGDVPLAEVQVVEDRGARRLECGPHAIAMLGARGFRGARLSVGCDGVRVMAWVVLF